MEVFRTEDMPVFKSPEEEIAFLREHVRKQEQILSGKGLESSTEKITSSLLEDYKNIPSEKILNPQNKISEKHEDAIVLALKPEAHDSTMEELYSMLVEKGLKNTLSVVERMNSPHISDDFHRFVVQFIMAGLLPKNDMENTPIAKALNMKLFIVTLPQKSENDTKTFKEMISVMEQFYSGMQSISNDRENKTKEYFTLEVALSSASDEVVFYVGVPAGKDQLFEKILVASFPEAKIHEAKDDYNIFNVSGATSGAFGTQSASPVFPIKTYDNFDSDPLSALLSVFSKMQKVGEGASLQFIITPAGDSFISKFNKILDKVKEGESLKEAEKHFGIFNKELMNIGRELLFGPSKKEEIKEKKIDENVVGKIGEKVKSTIVSVGMRVIASAENKSRADAILSELESAFNQFSDPQSNSIIFKKVLDNYLPKFLNDFSFRIDDEDHAMPLNIKELSTLIHFPWGISGSPQLRQAKSGDAPAPLELMNEGIILGVNNYRGIRTEVRMGREDRMRHLYVIGQTGTGKTTILKNMIAQDIANGDGCCYIDPHGTDIQDILGYIPKERIDDVIYFDPAFIDRPMGLNMLEFDPRFPEQKTMVIDTLMMIFNQLFDMKTGGGPMFEQYFKNSALLVMEDPESGSTLLEISRVLSDKTFRDMKLEKCKNPIVKQFWESAEKTTGDQGLQNFVPYITSKFDNFISNEFMRPVVLQQKSVLNFRDIIDNKKILLVNLSKGRLGELNANLIGMLIVMKFQMAALSRVDSYGKKLADFYLYIDEFQNVTTPAIASILSEARKYRLSLNIAHQYIGQLTEEIKGAVFGNVGSMAVFRVSNEDAEFIESKFAPVFTARDISSIDNRNAYMSMLINGSPARPFNIATLPPREANLSIVEKLRELSYTKYGKDRAEVEAEIFGRFKQSR
jgi:hypothetical protein